VDGDKHSTDHSRVTPATRGHRPPARHSRPRRDDVRRRLLDAALHVFADTGFDAASIDQVAAAAGFTKGAVYSNFASKDELFFALMDQQVTARIAVSRQVLQAHPAGDPGEALARIGDQLTEAFGQDRDWQLLFLDYWRRAVRDEQVRHQFVQHRRALRASITTVIDALPYDPAQIGLTSDELVTLVLALFNGLAIERLTDPGTVPDDLLGKILTLPTPPRNGGLALPRSGGPT
jgi:AcrR family transcriptional regulator